MTKSIQDNGLVGMRVLATLGIAFFHFELSYPFIEGIQIFSTAYLLVEFFFMLSGFLFAKGVLDGKYRNKSLILIIKDRIMRLWPTYIVGLILLPIVYSLVWYEGNYFKWLLEGSHLKSYLAEVFMLQSIGVSRFEYINGPAWYVSALLFATIVAWFAIKKIGKGNFIFLISICLYIFIGIFESPSMSTQKFILKYIPVPLLRGIAGVLLGVSLYYCYTKIGDKIFNLSRQMISVIEIVAFLLGLRLLLYRNSNWLNFGVLIPFSILIIVMYSDNKGVLSKILSNKKWSYLSNISFAFYIMQSFCSNILTCMCPNVKQPWAFIWYMFFNCTCAIIVYELVEKKLIKRKM